MNNPTDITVQKFRSLRLKVVDNYRLKGMKASGAFENSLEILPLQNGAVLVGLAYGEQLEKGRQPTQATEASSPSLLEQIKDWIQVKGITPKDDISEDSLAFLITRKIHESGWNRSKHGGLQLITDSISEDDFSDIISAVLDAEVTKFQDSIIKILK